jgi:hypothetical protein
MVGVYRFWRDFGFVLGALVAGLVADAAGSGAAIALVAAMTGGSGLWVAATRWTSREEAAAPAGAPQPPAATGSSRSAARAGAGWQDPPYS